GQLRITAYGIDVNGVTSDITESSKTAYISNNTAIVTVSNTGVATAVGPGKTVILVQNIHQIGSDYYPIEVNVPQPTISDVSPASGSVGAIVTISGAGFGPTQGVCVVTFSGI